MNGFLRRFAPLIGLVLAAVIYSLYLRAKRRNQKKSKAMKTDNEQRTPAEKNLNAFLWMIRFAEGTARADGYRVVYGYGTVLKDLSDHPIATGEWEKVRLSKEQCVAAGFPGGQCVTTAAGAYQITYTTWKNLKAKLKLKDFSPQSQDLAAIQLIRESKALEDVQAGKLDTAVRKVRHIWASLPGNTAGQPKKTLSELTAYFKSMGGTLYG